MSRMKINGMSLSAYSDYMKKKHGHKKNLEMSKPVVKNNNELYLGGTHPATFEEVLRGVSIDHAMIRAMGR